MENYEEAPQRPCTEFPSEIDPADMIKRGFFIVQRTATNGDKSYEYLKLENVYKDEMYFKDGGVIHRAVYIASPTLFHHPGVTGEGDSCGYIMGFDIRGNLNDGIAYRLKTLAIKNVVFMEKRGVPQVIE